LRLRSADFSLVYHRLPSAGVLTSRKIQGIFEIQRVGNPR